MIAPIIFLDIDGVLATIRQFALAHNSKSWIHKYDCYPFDKLCVNVLNEIIVETRCDIVLTSDWRIYYTLDQLHDIFTINGVIKTPFDVTVQKNTSAMRLAQTRASEILEYVAEYDIQKYIAIDDLDMQFWLEKEHFQLCGNQFEGIKQSGIKEKIINKLR